MLPMMMAFQEYKSEITAASEFVAFLGATFIVTAAGTFVGRGLYDIGAGSLKRIAYGFKNYPRTYNDPR